MSLVAAYEYDLFISYAHGDNFALEGQRGWVDHFHEALEGWLRHRRGLTALTIWRDEALSGNTLFDDAIRDRIGRSALFVALHSRNFRASEYCRLELETFHQANGSPPGGVRAGESARVFNVLLNNLPHDQWWPQFPRASGFAMHDAEREDELGDLVSPRDARFEQGLRRIVDAIEATLAVLVEQGAPAPAPAPERSGPRIFLADAPDSLATLRTRLATEIEGNGGHVLERAPPPYGAVEHRARLDELLARADASIHLFGPYPGRAIEGDDGTTYSGLQARVAMDGPRETVLWLSDAVRPDAVEYEGHRAWLEHLEADERDRDRYTLLRCTEHALLDAVRQHLDALRAVPANDEPPASCLIDTHDKDQRAAFALASLLSGAGMDVEFNKDSQDPTRSLENFERMAQRVRQLVIVCGRVGEQWLHQRIKGAVKVAVGQMDTDDGIFLEHIWVLRLPQEGDGAPLPRLPPVFQVHEIDHRHSERIDPVVVAPLLHAGAAGAGDD